MRKRQPSAIRQSHNKSNVIAERLREARRLHTPVMTHQLTSDRASALSGYAMTRDMLVRIEQQQRSVYDFEVVALSMALGVDVRFLLGMTDEPGPVMLLPLPTEARDD